MVETLASVWAQDLTDFEVIVVDDGSIDDTVATLRQMDEPRLRLIEQANGGASAARNTGIDHARGQYVAFLDSDDQFLPHHLSNLLPLLRRSPMHAAYTQVIADRGNRRRLLKPARALRPGEAMADYLLRDRGFIQTSGLALSREVAAAVRYREDVSFGDDTDFAIRLHLAGCIFVMTEEPSVVWSDTPREDRLSVVRSIRLNLDWLEDLRPVIPSAAYRGYLGWHAAKNVRPGHGGQALRLYLHALVSGAYSPRLALIIFLQIFLPDRLYRSIADEWIRYLARRRGIEHAETPVSEDGGSPREHVGG